MNDDLLHSAWEARLSAYDEATHAAAKVGLQSAFPAFDEATIDEAYARGLKLYEIAYSLADRVRDRVISESAARMELRQECPGFSERTYGLAYARGLQDSR